MMLKIFSHVQSYIFSSDSKYVGALNIAPTTVIGEAFEMTGNSGMLNSVNETVFDAIATTATTTSKPNSPHVASSLVALNPEREEALEEVEEEKKDEDSLDVLFKSLDRNGDGALTRTELLRALNNKVCNNSCLLLRSSIFPLNFQNVDARFVATVE